MSNPPYTENERRLLTIAVERQMLLDVAAEAASVTIRELTAALAAATARAEAAEDKLAEIRLAVEQGSADVDVDMLPLTIRHILDKPKRE